jgi:hypothetical protein
VRVTYVGNKAAGQWKAHGRYLSRESATHRTAQRQAGFDESQQKLDVAHQLDEWQQAGDPRLWKIIVSPEFGEKLDLQQLARGVMAGVEKEVGAGVEWIAVAHYNTGHPHAHIAMRGIDRQGREIRLPKEFVKRGIRQIAEDWCTQVRSYWGLGLIAVWLHALVDFPMQKPALALWAFVVLGAASAGASSKASSEAVAGGLA